MIKEEYFGCLQREGGSEAERPPAMAYEGRSLWEK
jgi:hypothetical protein